MADQQQRAGIVRDQLLEQFQGFGIQVVGRFVHDQQVAGLGEQPSEQQAITLAARQHAHGRIQALGRKQEIAKITRHVPRLTVDDHGIAAAAGHIVGDGRSRIELLALLIKIGRQ